MNSRRVVSRGTVGAFIPVDGRPGASRMTSRTPTDERVLRRGLERSTSDGNWEGQKAGHRDSNGGQTRGMTIRLKLRL